MSITRFSVPRLARSREDRPVFHLRFWVFYLGRRAFAQRSLSVVGERLDQCQLSLRRAEVRGVVAFGETSHDLAEWLVCIG
jgi:hypothetical protein